MKFHSRYDVRGFQWIVIDVTVVESSSQHTNKKKETMITFMSDRKCFDKEKNCLN